MRKPYALHRVTLLALLALGLASPAAPQTRPQTPARLFEFRSSFWMNLHHTLLYEAQLAAEPGSGPKPLIPPAPADRQTWKESVEFYRLRFGGKRPLADKMLLEINRSLMNAPDFGRGFPDLPPEIRAKLAGASGVYRSAWWDEQDKSNREWIAWAQPLAAKYGPEIAPQLEKLFGVTWDLPVRVDVSYYVAEVGGAYTVDGPPHTTLASARINKDWSGLEVLFHEASHVLTEKLVAALAAECKAQNKDCGDLWHATQFYTVGDVVKRTLAKHGVPDYVPYADQFGVYQRGQWPRYKAALDKAWPPYLEGKVGLDAAIHDLVAALWETGQVEHLLVCWNEAATASVVLSQPDAEMRGHSHGGMI